MDNHHCRYCSRSFKFKDLYDQHIPTCEFYSKRQIERDREKEAFEISLPSPQEQYKLIQHLMLTCETQQREIDKLKNAIVVRKKRIILEQLNRSTNVPNSSFAEWIKNIPVNLSHLECVFSVDLTEGIKQCIRDLIESKENIPLRAFTQKNGTIYACFKVNSFTKAPELGRSPTLTFGSRLAPNSEMVWRILSCEDFDKWIDRISHRFLQEFLKWQLEHSEQMNSSDDEKDRNLEYMRRINGGGKLHDDRRKSEMRKWVYTQLEKDIQTNVEYDYM